VEQEMTVTVVRPGLDLGVAGVLAGADQSMTVALPVLGSMLWAHIVGFDGVLSLGWRLAWWTMPLLGMKWKGV
jgi:hypothetical protein